MNEHKGMIVHVRNGKLVASEIDLPIHTHAAVMTWGMDMIRAIHELGLFRKWILRIVLGRFAYRELVGLRDAIEKEGYSTTIGYSLETMDYHNEAVKL